MRRKNSTITQGGQKCQALSMHGITGRNHAVGTSTVSAAQHARSSRVRYLFIRLGQAGHGCPCDVITVNPWQDAGHGVTGSTDEVTSGCLMPCGMHALLGSASET